MYAGAFRARLLRTHVRGRLMDSLGARLKHVRGSRSQREFAEFLGVAVSTYQLYEGDKRLPAADFLGKVIGEGWPAGWLLTGMGTYSTRDALPTLHAKESTDAVGSQQAIDRATWDRAMRIVQLAADPIDPKPRPTVFANAVAEIYNAIIGRPQDNNELPDLIQHATGALLGGNR